MNAITPLGRDLLAARRAEMADHLPRLLRGPGLTLVLVPAQATPATRLAAARALLAGTGHSITEAPDAG
jgi:hypothetical protein